MPDGEYVLRYRVDPLGQIAEDGRTANNEAETRFSVRDGALVGLPVPPRCAITGPDLGAPGATIDLSCSHFPDRAPVMVYWGEWDPWATDALPVMVVQGQGLAPFEVAVTIPQVEPGAWVITLVAWDFERGGNVSATVIVYVEPAAPATPGATPATRHVPGAARA
jgi:hypothetical protein